MFKSLFAVLTAAALFAPVVRAEPSENGAPTRLNEATVTQLQAMMSSGQLSSVELTRYYLDRIERLDQNGPSVNAIIEVNPDALAAAAEADQQRAAGNVKGPLHGIPVVP